MSDQLSLLSPPIRARARRGDVDTSREAARSIAPSAISEVQAAVLEIFRTFGPMHDEKLVRIYERFARDNPHRYPLQTQQGIRSRRAELADPEKSQPVRIEFSGRYDVTTTGRRTRVWQLV